MTLFLLAASIPAHLLASRSPRPRPATWLPRLRRAAPLDRARRRSTSIGHPTDVRSRPDPGAARARTAAFALALETPGGLKVQTIHAFCTRLLHQFPFEATVAARFDVLDEASEAQLLSETSLAVLLDAAWPRMPRSAARSQPPLRSPPTGPSRRSWAKPSANVTWYGRGSITAAASTRPCRAVRNARHQPR